MRLVNLEQGSPEWNRWRREKATASAAAVIMSCTPRWMNVRTWPDLHLSMAGLGPIPSKWEQRAYDHGSPPGADRAASTGPEHGTRLFRDGR